MSKRQALSVKISKDKVVKSLEEALVKLDARYKKAQEDDGKWEKEHQRWEQEVLAIALGKVQRTNLRIHERSWSNTKTLNIDFDIDASLVGERPNRDNYEYLSENAWQEERKEIKSTIRILNMSDDEYINTSTYNHISKYL